MRDAKQRHLELTDKKVIGPIGSTKRRSVDIRLIVVTNEDLQQLVEQGRFRADLYHRISCFPIRIPPLRERMEDLPFLVDVLRRKAVEQGTGVGMPVPNKPFAPAAIRELMRYDYPGNVRELDTYTVCAMVGSCKERVLREDVLNARKRLNPSKRSLTKSRCEPVDVSQLIDAAAGRRTIEQAALSLQLSRWQYARQLERHGLKWSELRKHPK